MKKSLVFSVNAFILGLLALSSTQVLAKDIPVKFTSGSYCGSYSGRVLDSDAFSLYLQKGQTLSVSVEDGEINKVLNPYHKKLIATEEISDTSYYKIHQSGKYRVFITSDLKAADIEFCAY